VANRAGSNFAGDISRSLGQCIWRALPVMGVSEYLPVAVAGCCAAAVAYIALSQAYEAADADDAGSPSTSGSEAPKAASQAHKAVANGQIVPAGQHAAEASTSSSSSTTAPSSSSRGNPSSCNHCKKVPEKLEHLLRCSRCHQAWYCSKVWADSIPVWS
jgi:hypothetical protein